MKKLLLIIMLMPIITLAQNTFYTKGVSVSTWNQELDDYEFVEELPEKFGKFTIIDDFTYVNITTDEFDLDLEVISTKVLDEEDFSKGYILFCAKNDLQINIYVKLDTRNIWLFSDDNVLDFKIRLIK